MCKVPIHPPPNPAPYNGFLLSLRPRAAPSIQWDQCFVEPEIISPLRFERLQCEKEKMDIHHLSGFNHHAAQAFLSLSHELVWITTVSLGPYLPAHETLALQSRSCFPCFQISIWRHSLHDCQETWPLLRGMKPCSYIYHPWVVHALHVYLSVLLTTEGTSWGWAFSNPPVPCILLIHGMCSRRM